MFERKIGVQLLQAVERVNKGAHDPKPENRVIIHFQVETAYPADRTRVAVKLSLNDNAPANVRTTAESMEFETLLIANMRNRGFDASRKFGQPEFGMSHNAEFMRNAMKDTTGRGGFGGRGGRGGNFGGNNFGRNFNQGYNQNYNRGGNYN